MPPVHAFRRLWLIALLSIALVATAFAHKIPTASDLALDAYVLAGGSMADLCGDGDGDGAMAHRDCQACSIIGTAMLPDAPQAVTRVNYAYVATIVAPRAARAIRTVLDPARAMRAPPLA